MVKVLTVTDSGGIGVRWKLSVCAFSRVSLICSVVKANALKNAIQKYAVAAKVMKSVCELGLYAWTQIVYARRAEAVTGGKENNWLLWLWEVCCYCYAISLPSSSLFTKSIFNSIRSKSIFRCIYSEHRWPLLVEGTFDAFRLLVVVATAQQRVHLHSIYIALVP